MNAEVVREEIQNILESPSFNRTVNSKKILQFLTEGYLNNPERDFKEYVIGVDVLGKPREFNPQLDTVVRVEMNRLRSRLAAFYRKRTSETSCRIFVPVGRYKLDIEEGQEQNQEKNYFEQYPPQLFLEQKYLHLHLNLEKLFLHGSEETELIAQWLISGFKDLDFCTCHVLNNKDAVSKTNGKPDFTVHTSVFERGGLINLFVNLVEQEKESIIFSKRFIVDTNNTHRTEEQVHQLLQDMVEFIHPLSLYTENRILSKNKQHCSFWDLNHLLSLHEVYGQYYCLQKVSEILQNSPVGEDLSFKSLSLRAKIVDQLFWRHNHDDLLTEIDRYRSELQGSLTQHPLHFETLFWIFLFEKDLDSIKDLCSSMAAQRIAHPLLKGHLAWAYILSGDIDGGTKLMETLNENSPIPSPLWSLIPAMTYLQKEDYASFFKQKDRLAQTSQPWLRLLTLTAEIKTGKKNIILSSYTKGLLQEILARTGPLEYLFSTTGLRLEQAELEKDIVNIIWDQSSP